MHDHAQWKSGPGVVRESGPWTGSMRWSMDQDHSLKGGPWTWVHVFVQSCGSIYPWFKFSFSFSFLFFFFFFFFLGGGGGWGMVMYDNEFKTKKNKIWTKDKIEPLSVCEVMGFFVPCSWNDECYIFLKEYLTYGACGSLTKSSFHILTPFVICNWKGPSQCKMESIK